MLDRVVCDGEFSKEVANHFTLDLNRVENFSIVNPNLASNHFWDNDHRSKMRLDNGWLISQSSFLFRFAESFQQGHGLTLQASGELAASTLWKELGKFFIAEVEEGFQFKSTVSEFLESALFLEIRVFFF